MFARLALVHGNRARILSVGFFLFTILGVTWGEMQMVPMRDGVRLATNVFLPD